MAQRVSNGNGVYTLPLDPRTGARMDETAWQRYMADFMQEVRAALPGVEIVHNTIWTVGDATPDLRRQLNAADYIELERGFNDAGIVGGASKFGWQTLASFIDRRHADGRAVILDGYADSAAGRLYGLAALLPAELGPRRAGQRRGDAARRLLEGLRRRARRGARPALPLRRRLAARLRGRRRARQRAGLAGAHRRRRAGAAGRRRRRALVGDAGRGLRGRAAGRRPRRRAGRRRTSRAAPSRSAAGRAPASALARRARRVRVRGRGVAARRAARCGSSSSAGSSRRWATVRRRARRRGTTAPTRAASARLSRGRYRVRAVYADRASGYRGFRIRP